MKNQRLTLIVAAAAMSFVATGAALACGDKLVALGGGVGYQRVMMSRHPGRIALLAEPATGLAAANDRLGLASSLAQAGHEVHVVKSMDELRSAHDVILVDASRVSELHVRPVAGDAAPTILPVAYPAQGEAAAGQRTCVTVASGRRGTQVLLAVEKALKLRSRGQPMTCESAAGQQA